MIFRIDYIQLYFFPLYFEIRMVLQVSTFHTIVDNVLHMVYMGFGNQLRYLPTLYLEQEVIWASLCTDNDKWVKWWSRFIFRPLALCITPFSFLCGYLTTYCNAQGFNILIYALPALPGYPYMYLSVVCAHVIYGHQPTTREIRGSVAWEAAHWECSCVGQYRTALCK